MIASWHRLTFHTTGPLCEEPKTCHCHVITCVITLDFHSSHVLLSPSYMIVLIQLQFLDTYSLISNFLLTIGIHYIRFSAQITVILIDSHFAVSLWSLSHYHNRVSQAVDMIAVALHLGFKWHDRFGAHCNTCQYKNLLHTAHKWWRQKVDFN